MHIVSTSQKRKKMKKKERNNLHIISTSLALLSSLSDSPFLFYLIYLFIYLFIRYLFIYYLFVCFFSLSFYPNACLDIQKVNNNEKLYIHIAAVLENAR